MATRVERMNPYSADAAARRKSNKPLMEKKRRERINKCLNELQSLLLENSKEHSHSKLEKADILEMTVKHIRTIRRQTLNGFNQRPATEELRYRQAYPECNSQITQLSGKVHKSSVAHPDLSVQIPTPPTSPIALNNSPAQIYQGSFVPIQGGVALLINQQTPQQQLQQQLTLQNVTSYHHNTCSSVRAKQDNSVWRPWDRL